MNRQQNEATNINSMLQQHRQWVCASVYKGMAWHRPGPSSRPRYKLRMWNWTSALIIHMPSADSERVAAVINDTVTQLKMTEDFRKFFGGNFRTHNPKWLKDPKWLMLKITDKFRVTLSYLLDDSQSSVSLYSLKILNLNLIMYSQVSIFS